MVVQFFYHLHWRMHSFLGTVQILVGWPLFSLLGFISTIPSLSHIPLIKVNEPIVEVTCLGTHIAGKIRLACKKYCEKGFTFAHRNVLAQTRPVSTMRTFAVYIGSINFGVHVPLSSRRCLSAESITYTCTKPCPRLQRKFKRTAITQCKLSHNRKL